MQIDKDEDDRLKIFCQLLDHKWLFPERNNEDGYYFKVIADYTKLGEFKFEKDEAENTEPIKT